MSDIKTKLVYASIFVAVLILVFELGIFSSISAINTPHTSSKSSKSASGQETEIKTQNGIVKINEEQILKELLPERKTLPVTWQGIPFTLLDKGLINVEKLIEYSARYGQKVTEDDLKIFKKDYNGNIEITPNNSVLIYNVLWAIGFAAKSPILDYELEKYGWDTIQRLAGYYFSFANLGNGSTLPQSGYNYFNFIPLNEEQKNMVMKIAGKSAVPSCGNSLLLPDCSCSFAVDALISMMASQGFSEKEIYQAMKDVYPYRFPGVYLRHALLYKLDRNQNWSDVDAEELVSVQFSSAQGVARLSSALANILGLQKQTENDH